MATVITYKRELIITETLNEVKNGGYVLELRRDAASIYCPEWQQWIMPANFTVDRCYYFDEVGSPDADRILYAISLSQGGKGFLIDACNVYADNMSHELMSKLRLTRIIIGKEKKPRKLTPEMFW